MIDLRNIARQLRLPADHLRQAADLLQQGYHPAFIAKYRSDETGALPERLLWPLKLGIERQQRLEAARQKAVQQLGEGVELDDESRSQLEQCSSEVEIESILRAFRARKAARQTGERSVDASQILEKMIAYQGEVVADVTAWVAAQLSVDTPQAEVALQLCARLVGNLVAGDARLADRMRHAIQKRSSVRVELLSDSPAPMSTNKIDSPTVAVSSAAVPPPMHVGDARPAMEEGSVGTTESTETPTGLEPTATDLHDHSETSFDDHSELDGNHHDDAFASDDRVDAASDESNLDDEPAATQPSLAEGHPADSGTSVAAKKASDHKKNRAIRTKKPLDKLTPRQRRRRWLVSILQPFRSLNKPLAKLSAYQLLMLGRGQRSQLARLKLTYDVDSLLGMARDVFVSERHPLADWFARAASDGLRRSLLPKLEADAVMELEEFAQQRLLESATEQLRTSLLQRPIRGHCILVIDTVGPKMAALAIVDHIGKVLATDEISCAGSQPAVVSQNLMRLGELVHRFKVTLVALSNGPARRFLIHTVAELMRQSADTNLRWSMVDRGGAEAYAASRTASEELPQYNRRIRAVVWMARRIQDPMREMLKVDASRLRLGSYQRELPQDSVQHLVHDTIADCLAVNGVDTLWASTHELEHVPGVDHAQASQIDKLVGLGRITSRADLLSHVENWPQPGSRQALGFLRVYGSSESLDATAIHPEDYRLAQRIIQNTDLKPPPASPNGWVRPALAVSKAPTQPSTGIVQDTLSSESAEPALQQSAADTSSQISAAQESFGSLDVTPSGGAVTDESVDPAISAASNSDSSARVEGTLESPPIADATGEPSAATPEFPEDAPPADGKTLAIDVEKYARSWQVGRAKVQWVANCLNDPFADQRLRRPWPALQREVPTFDSLKPGMCVWAVVVGVADFGAFVELGPDCSGLIHISRLSVDYIEDPHERVQIGDVLQTWVVSTDPQKKRVALTVISPDEQREIAQAAEQQREEQRQQQQRDQAPAQRRFDSNRSASGPADRAQNASRGGDRQTRVAGGGSAGQSGGRRQGGRGGRYQGSRPATEIASKPVVIKSKQPKKPITDAMQKGKEPLRSFSDLMQYYELQRSDEIPPPAELKSKDEPSPPTLEGPAANSTE